MKRMIVLWALLFTVSPGFADQIRVDYDHAAHFSVYKTYSWDDSAAPKQETQFPNQLMRERVAGYIEEALAARGLKHVPTGGDLLISYQIHVTQEPVYTTFSDGAGWGWDWGWGSSFSTTTVQTFDQGTLVIDMVDANQKKLVFQGTATQDISSKPAKNAKRLCKGVNEVFEKYPPRP
jgi:Domain of unknown function (DUF4136)